MSNSKTYWHSANSPPTTAKWVRLRFAPDGPEHRGFYYKAHGAFYLSMDAMRATKPVHPTHWAEEVGR